MTTETRIFLLADLRDIFSDFSADWSFSEFFFNISRTNSKTSEVNQQSGLNL